MSAQHHVDDQIARLFESGLGPKESAALFDHIRECSSCEGVYERYAAAERALYGDPDDALNVAAIDRVARRVVADAETSTRTTKTGWWVPVGLLAAAVAGAFLVARVEMDDQLTKRGTEEVVDAAYAVRALRIRTAPAEEVRVDDASSNTLRAGDQMKLLYSTGATPGRLTVTVVDEDQRVLYRSEPVEVRANEVEAKLPGSISVATDWRAGPVEIVATFVSADGERRVRVAKSTVEAP